MMVWKMHFLLDMASLVYNYIMIIMINLWGVELALKNLRNMLGPF